MRQSNALLMRQILLVPLLPSCSGLWPNFLVTLMVIVVWKYITTTFVN